MAGTYSRQQSVRLPLQDSVPEVVAVQIMEVIYTTDALKKSVTYKVRVSITQVNDTDGTTEVLRKYHDFANVRKALADLWPGIFIPAVPPKKLIVRNRQGNTSADIVEDRRLVLEEFLRKTAHCPELLASTPLQEFLKSQDGYVPSAPTSAFSSEVVERYRATYSQYLHDCPASATEALAQFQSFLTQTLRTMQSIRSVAKTTSAVYQQRTTLNSQVGEYAQRFERECLSEYMSRQSVSIFKYPDLDMRCNPFTLISDWTKLEVSDLKAMLDAVQWCTVAESNRRKTESKLSTETANLQKLQGGKSSIAQIFSLKGKPDLLAKTEQKVAQDATDLSRIICNLLLEREIPSFRTSKSEQYTVLLKAFTGSMRLEGEQAMSSQCMKALEATKAATR